MKRRPWFTVCTCGAALLVWVIPELAGWLVYDRQAILSGEVWRLLTGHLAHFSGSQLALDVAAFGLAGWLLESRWGAPRLAMFLAVPAGISLALLLFEPDMARYGGLSGVATAGMLYGALSLLGGGSAMRALGWVVLTGLAVKTACEWGNAAPLFASMPSATIVTATLSHIAGAVLALLVFGVKRIEEWQTRSTTTPQESEHVAHADMARAGFRANRRQ